MSPNPVIVTKRTWLDGDTGPELHLELSTGAWVKIAWDTTYHHRLLYVAADEFDDFRDATTDETGLSADVLADYVDEVYRATVREDDERAECSGVAPGDEGCC